MTLPTLPDFLTGIPPAVLWSALVAVVVAVVLAAVVVAVRRLARRPASDTPPRGTGGFWLAAVIGTVVSMDTSWLFFGDVLGITGIERSVMFGIVEITLFACGWSMRAAVRRKERPGPARVLAWVLCGMAAYMALVEAGPVAGMARVILGPVTAVITLHLALGVELRIATGEEKVTTWSRVFGEVRERVLSRIGLADDDRSAAARTRDRAADRAARLATATHTPFRGRRLARALRVAGVAHDPATCDRMLAQLAVYRGLDALSALRPPSPWSLSASADQAPDDARALTAGALPEAPVSPAAPEDLTAVSRTAAVVWAHITLGSQVPAARIVAWLADQGVEVSESLVYKVRRSARALGADVSALVEGSGEYPVLALSAPEDSPSA